MPHVFVAMDTAKRDCAQDEYVPRRPPYEGRIKAQVGYSLFSFGMYTDKFREFTEIQAQTDSRYDICHRCDSASPPELLTHTRPVYTRCACRLVLSRLGTYCLENFFGLILRNSFGG
jgi:hypothetical protein